MSDGAEGAEGSALRPDVSVLMPTFEQAHFIGRALASLQAQTLARWEALIVDDGSQDATGQAVAPWLADPRIRYLRLEHNEGLGRALNLAMDASRAPLLAYLPSDDLLYPEHLERLAAALDGAPSAVLAYAGMRHHGGRESEGQAPGAALQLVQCMHRRVALRWTERAELESDDLERLFWSMLRPLGVFVGTGVDSCAWTDHPDQRHKRMREPLGGVNPFRQRYRVRAPLRFHSSVGNAIDEPGLYRSLRERPPRARSADGLKILLVGELGRNAERVLALEEQGHTLYGLWTGTPHCFNTVGPLPFGNVEDLPRHDWQAAIRRLRPDIIYGLLNWQAVPFAHEVLLASAGIPFVWHFKDDPFSCIEQGSWAQLLDLYRRADGQVYSSAALREWFDAIAPGLSSARPALVLDGDLPKRAWFDAPASPRPAAHAGGADGDLHTVVPGRPVGLEPHTVAELAAERIHLHVYGDFARGPWRDWAASAAALAPRHLHLHPGVAQDRWAAEFSRYDAGWLHCFVSRNRGEPLRAEAHDLRLPSRIPALAMAGLPMIQRDNHGALVAAQALARAMGIGLFYRDTADLADQLRDGGRMARLRERVRAQRMQFCFDTHVSALLALFRDVIAAAGAARRDACC